jgi:hypothetical protein
VKKLPGAQAYLNCDGQEILVGACGFEPQTPDPVLIRGGTTRTRPVLIYRPEDIALSLYIVLIYIGLSFRLAAKSFHWPHQEAFRPALACLRSPCVSAIIVLH